ncbi:MAG: hypothetical protein JEY97_01425 [Bacteroidales bacterium]|nr:hypothetical protein [Bacteroidales bacterium]
MFVYIYMKKFMSVCREEKTNIKKNKMIHAKPADESQRIVKVSNPQRGWKP